MVNIQWTEKALKSLVKIHKQDAKRIQKATEQLTDWPNVKNIKKLKSHKHEYRLRVGNYRVFFNVVAGEFTIIRIEEVKKRDERTY